MIQSKPTVRDSLIQALGGMAGSGQMQGGASSGQMPSWMGQAISQYGGQPARPQPMPQMNPQDAAMLGSLAGGIGQGVAPQQMGSALGAMGGNRQNQGRPMTPINMASLGSSLGGIGATTKPLPMQSMENGQRLKIDPARINNFVRPNLLAGQRQQTMTSQPFNKPLGSKKPVKKPAKKPGKR